MSRVLVVDDEEVMRDLVSARLRQAGHRVVSAASGEAALEVVDGKGAPDVVVVDIGLPDMDGYALLGALREAAGEPSLAAVFLSGHVDDSSIRRGRQMGAVYLTKPFVASALLTAVEKAQQPREAEAGW